MIKRSLSVILGIAPGAKQIGVSVFKDQELLFYAVKTFKKQIPARSLENLRKIVGELTVKYRVTGVALIRTVFVQQRRSFVKIVDDEIKTHLQRQNIATVAYDPRLVRRIICGPENPTKHNTSLILSERYAELARYFNVPQVWQKTYFAKLFDAVAVGLVGSFEYRKSKLPPSKTRE